MATVNRAIYEQIFQDFSLANKSTGIKTLDRNDFRRVVESYFPNLNVPYETNHGKVINGFLDWLDDDFKLASDSGLGESGRALISNINLLPLFEEYANSEESKNIVGLSESRLVKAIEKTRGLIVNQLIDLEIENMKVENFGSTSAMSEEELRTAALTRVNERQVYSPLYVASVQATKIDPITNQAADSASMENAGSESPEFIGSEEMFDSWSEYLRLTPNSSVYDLQTLDLQASEDDEYTEGFDATMFANWLSPKEKDKVNAKTEDGQPVRWSASQAIKFIYDLADAGQTAKINELQTMLREAGYFSLLGEGFVLPIPGVVDKSMEQAWGLFLTDAARMNKTPAQMFADKKRQYLDMTKTGVGLVGEDISAISQNIDGLAYEILGRRLSPAEKQSLYSAVRSWEREQLATQLYDKQPTTVDIDARLAQLIERENANEIAFSVGESMNAKFRKWYGD